MSANTKHCHLVRTNNSFLSGRQNKRFTVYICYIRYNIKAKVNGQKRMFIRINLQIVYMYVLVHRVYRIIDRRNSVFEIEIPKLVICYVEIVE